MKKHLFFHFKSEQACGEYLKSILLASFLFCPAVFAQGAEPAQLTIKLDQVGYPLNGPKVALVSVPAATFEVRRSNDKVAVFKGRLAAVASDTNSGDRVQAADFSALRLAGRYFLEIPGVGRSWDFAIGPNVF